MRQVATIADERAAKRLADHLLTLDVTTRVDRGKDGWVVWVHREEKMDLARREVEQFLANPDDPRYDAAAKVAAVVKREKAKVERRHIRNTVNLSGRLNVPSFRRCPVTYSLIGLSVAVAILTGLGGDRDAIIPFVLSPPIETREWKTVPADPDDLDDEDATFVRARRDLVVRERPSGLAALRRGQAWRLVTPIFLHFGIIHLAFNMTMLYRLGSLVELRKGKLVMIGLAVASAVASNLAQHFWFVQTRDPDSIPWAAGGMSGVLYALFGYCWMKSDYDVEADMKVPTDLILWMVGWLVFCMAQPFLPIGNAAHLSGLVVGVLIGVAPHLFDRWR